MSEKNYTPPEYNKRAFHCPHCGTYAQQKWVYVAPAHTWNGPKTLWTVEYSECLYEHCGKQCLWIDEKMLLPDVSGFPNPNNDMPESIQNIYNEASAVANKSLRAAAALLRLALHELCKYLGAKTKNLQTDIDFLMQEKGLPSKIVEAMDIVRIVGNDAAHPGEIEVGNKPEIVEALFRLINFIAEKMISEPKRMEEEISKVNQILPDSKKRRNFPKE